MRHLYMLLFALPSASVRNDEEDSMVTMVASRVNANTSVQLGGPAEDFLHAADRNGAKGLKKFCTAINQARGLRSTTGGLDFTMKCSVSNNRPPTFELLGEMTTPRVAGSYFGIRSKMDSHEFNNMVTRGLKDDGSFSIRLGYCDNYRGNDPGCVEKAKAAGFKAIDSSASFYLHGKIVTEANDVGRDIEEFFRGTGSGFGVNTYPLTGQLDVQAGVEVITKQYGGHNAMGIEFKQL